MKTTFKTPEEARASLPNFLAVLAEANLKLTGVYHCIIAGKKVVIKLEK